MTYCNTMWRFLAAMRIILLMIFCWILYHWPVSSYKYFPAITRNYLGSRNLPLHPTFLQCKCFTLQWNCRASYLIDLLWSLVSSETTYLLQCHVALVCTNCTLLLQKMEIKMSLSSTVLSERERERKRARTGFLSTSWNTWGLSRSPCNEQSHSVWWLRKIWYLHIALSFPLYSLLLAVVLRWRGG